MTTTRTKTRKTNSLFLGGRKGRYLHNSAKNFWMGEKVSSFLGTKSTDPFTRKHWCITLILARKD
jgi:hypothetical protein